MKDREQTGVFSLRKRFGVMISWILILSLVLGLTACTPAADGDTAQGEEGEESFFDKLAALGKEEVVLTPPPDGDPATVACKGTYTVTDEDAAANGNVVVATIGEDGLTNSALQIYYWMEVAAYKAAGHEITPDDTIGLDVQMCALDDNAITWQQFFLQRALNTWYSHRAMASRGRDVKLALEAAYKPDDYHHDTYLSEDLPAMKYLYGYYNDFYEPNAMHQEFLDGLPGLLEVLAAANGFETVEAQLLDMAGAGAGREDLEAYAWLYNWCYMYYTQLTYEMDLSDKAVKEYFTANEEEYTAAGVTKDGSSAVSLRHVLLLPEDTSDDGWAACQKKAEEMLAKWKKDTRKVMSSRRLDNAEEAEFGELAYAKSADKGTAPNGGLLSGLHNGDLAPSMNEWAFSEDRKAGDIEIIRTDLGCHIVYFCGREGDWFTRAKSDLQQQKASELVIDAMNNYPMTVDYTAIVLGKATQSGPVITAEDILYPDIAHERFPTAPVYLQRDYLGTMYGAYPVYTYGCGITTLAMLASYYTDEEWTVPELCAMYGGYCFKTGSDYALYDNAPCELGFFGIHRATSGWDEVSEALEEGKACVSLQRGGYWTRRGHYILLQNFTEDGMVVVRDSNILNYGSIENHKIDAHEVKSITAKGIIYWICGDKVVRIGSCARCDDTNHRGAAMGILNNDYICIRCSTAMARRDSFTSAMNGINDIT